MGRRKWRLGWLGGAIALSLAESDGSDSDSGSSDSDSDGSSGSDDISGEEALGSVSFGSDSSYYSGTPSNNSSDDSSGSGDGPDQNQGKRKRVPGQPGVSVGMSDDDMSDIPGG